MSENDSSNEMPNDTSNEMPDDTPNGRSKKMTGRTINPGTAEGEAIVSSEPIGFYGGIDAETGIVTEKGHPLEGQCVTGKVLVFPCGKGSTVGSYVVYGLQINGVGPVALINKETETIVATGAILADVPCIDGIDIEKIKTGDHLKLELGETSGTVEVLL